LATQLRTYKQIQANNERTAVGVQQDTERLRQAQKEIAASKTKQAQLQDDIRKMQVVLGSRSSLTKTQLSVLNGRITDLQALAGLTPVTGPGVRVTLSDNPGAASGATGAAGAFLPGIVHDFDVLQVVNELRSAKADAISVNGPRVTGFTPIRCVGPAIYVNFEPVTAPFIIEAIGDPKTLQSALSMPNGIVDNLRNNGPIGVKIAPARNLSMHESGTTPSMKWAKITPQPAPTP